MSRKFQLGPFEHIPWRSEKQAAVDLFCEWHDYLRNNCPYTSGQEAKEAFASLKKKLEKKEPQDVIPEALLLGMETAIAQYGVSPEWFYTQLDGAHYFYGDIQFQNAKELKAFISSWEAPHTYLIAKLADAAYTWQRVHLDELAMAFFIVDGLLNLPGDLIQDRLFIPVSEMVQSEVELSQLKQGKITPAIERLLWKQTIRARDAFAQGQALTKELDRKYRGAAKKNWLTGLEYINEIEKRKYDLWSQPITLTRLQKFQIFALSWIGKGARQPRG